MNKDNIRRELNDLLQRLHVTPDQGEVSTGEPADMTAKRIGCQMTQLSPDDQVQLMKGLLEIQHEDFRLS
ncbi:MAG: hypothetical protein KF865_14470 [Bdellovibrionaceae bacterium]|nr:hypothetical protein [Pseudobdellovibrionaceae bacterium]